MARLTLSRALLAPLALGGLALAAGCGGGGGQGVGRPGPQFLLGSRPLIASLTTPSGLAGSRGSGPNVFVSFNIKDTEFNQSDIQIEYGWDVDGDTLIEPGVGTENPVPDDEYFEATRKAGVGDGFRNLDSTLGGAGHLFVWNSTADVPGRRFVTQDYVWTPTGRQVIGSNGQPLFGNTPGIKIRVRANDSGGDPARWGPWNYSDAFDLNNNSQPSITIATTGLNGVTPNPTGTAADENVVLNFNYIDADAGFSTDPGAVAVDYAPVPPGAILALVWAPASTFPGTADTGLASAVTPGAANTFTWDSVRDVGTVNGDYILRITPFDSKKELGPTVRMTERFRLDNYTIFTDSRSVLSAPRVGHRVTTLGDDTVLITGGRTTATGPSVVAAEVFFPGIGQTTYGAVASRNPMGSPRAYHTQTRLQDDRVLVTGGFDASGNPLSSMEVFDPVANTWTNLPAGLGTARARATAVLLADGNVLVAGGVSNSAGTALNTAVVVHVDPIPANFTVTTVGVPMAAARHSVEGALLPDARFLIPGGKDTANNALASVEIYNPTTDAFSAGPAMAAARAEHSVSGGTDGSVVVTGGVTTGGGALASIASFSYLTSTWNNALPAMSTARAGHVGILMGDGKVLAAGGSNGTSVVGTATQYNPVSAAYDTPNGDMFLARRDAAAAILNNGRALIVGGTDAAGAPTASIEIFTPDGGFNFAPTAVIVSPTEPQSWAFGGLFAYRLIDPEGNAAKVIFQYAIGTGPFKACTSKPGTIAGDVNDGIAALSTTTTNSALPVDPVLRNTPGDHLFIWDMAADLARADYDPVRVRVIPFGAARSLSATTNAFRIIKNSRMIPRFKPFAASVYGTVVIDYHLQDPDPDTARVEFEYGLDTNGNGQILAIDGETWQTCTEAPGDDGLGAGYTLIATTGYSAAGPYIDAAGWHTFNWDSVFDVGSPPVGTTWSNVFVRVTPYDRPAGDPAETKGRQAILGPGVANGNFSLVINPTGLFLTQWGPIGVTPTTGNGPFAAVKLDQAILFTFNVAVDPTSVEPGVIGQTTLPVQVGGRTILGTYFVDPADRRNVYFYPQTNGLANGALQYNGTENPTVLTRSAVAAINIPAYVAKTNPVTSPVLKKFNPIASEGTGGLVQLVSRTFSPGLNMTATAGSGAYYAYGVTPLFGTVTPTQASTGNATNSTFTITFDHPVSAESINPGATQTTFNYGVLRIVVDRNGNGLLDSADSIIPGTLTLVNTAGPNATNGATFTFTPLPGYTLPTGSRILVSFTGMTAGDGIVVAGTVKYFDTTGSTTVSSTFLEGFSDSLNKDAATTALWNVSPYLGVLTDFRDGGTGSDGTPTTGDSNVGTLRTFSAKNVYNFLALTIPAGETWRFTGTASNNPIVILVVGNAVISGKLDVSGQDGQDGVHDNPSTTSTTQPTTTLTKRAGGTGIAGGGAGGDSDNTPTASNGVYDGKDGLVGKSIQTTSPFTVATVAGGYGRKGLKGTTYTSGHGGGGAGAHAQNGETGYKYANSTSTTVGAGGAGGTLYGDSAFSTGLTSGAGGGGGGCSLSGTTYAIPGGGGGAGGGAVRIACSGTFKLAGRGAIDAHGGRGGTGFYYSGGGGGAAGGGVWILAGSTLTLNGIIDVRGGIGGRYLYYSGSSLAPNGTRGGNGSAGRVRIEGPDCQTDLVNFMGAAAFNTVASGSISGGTGALGAFPGSTTNVTVDGLMDASGFLNYSTGTIPSGVTVTLVGTAPAKLRFTSGFTINGVLSAPGGIGTNGAYSFNSAGTATGGTAGPGGGTGGISHNSGSTSHQNGGAGVGTGGGQGGQTGSGYLQSYGTWGYTFLYYPSAGGGGSNVLGDSGKAGDRCSLYRGYYKPGAGGAAGTPFMDPEALTTSTITGGSGGGAGMDGGYVYFNTNYAAWNYTYFYGAGNGGGGGGAISIETPGTFTMGTTGKILTVGGIGGAGYTSSGGGGGAGGSGGTVLVRATTLSVTGSGPTIDTSGGRGTKMYNLAYYDYGSTGGTGGFGGSRIETVNAPSFFNTGNLLGFSATTGSYTGVTYLGGGNVGFTKWQDAKALAGTTSGFAPDFTASAQVGLANFKVYLEGAQSTLNGGQSPTTTGEIDLSLAGNYNLVDGMRWFRLVFRLAAPSPATGCARPVVDSAQVSFDTK